MGRGGINLKAAALMEVSAGSAKTGARLVPLRCCPATCGSASPTSAANVGYRSTASPSTSVVRPTEAVIHGARIIRGVRTATSCGKVQAAGSYILMRKTARCKCNAD